MNGNTDSNAVRVIKAHLFHSCKFVFVKKGGIGKIAFLDTMRGLTAVQCSAAKIVNFVWWRASMESHDLQSFSAEGGRP